MDIDKFELENAADELLDAALDPALWAGTLARVAAATGSAGANIFPIRGRVPGLPATESVRDLLDGYFSDNWQERDFRVRGVPYVLKKTTAIEHDFTDEDEINRLDYYRLLEKYGFRWSALVGFKSGDDILCLILHRKLHDDPFSRHDEHTLGLVRDRLTMSAAVMRNMAASKIEGLAQAFETSGLASIFFDRNGLVNHCNLAAEALIGDDFQIRRGVVASWKPDEASTLLRKVRACTSIRNSVGDFSSPTIISRRDKPPLIIRVQKIGFNFSEVFAKSVAFATIESSVSNKEVDHALLARLYALTPIESLIAAKLASGNGIPAVAKQQGIAYETARSHVSSIFRKTGTNRQAELSALLANIVK